MLSQRQCCGKPRTRACRCWVGNPGALDLAGLRKAVLTNNLAVTSWICSVAEHHQCNGFSGCAVMCTAQLRGVRPTSGTQEAQVGSGIKTSKVADSAIRLRSWGGWRQKWDSTTLSGCRVSLRISVRMRWIRRIPVVWEEGPSCSEMRWPRLQWVSRIPSGPPCGAAIRPPQSEHHRQSLKPVPNDWRHLRISHSTMPPAG